VQMVLHNYGIEGTSKANLFFSIGSRTFDLSTRALIMGILNITPDSFSDGGKFFNPGTAIDQGCRMAEAGADVIDVGGESTRPFAPQVSPQEELDRVVPVIEGLKKQLDIPISIDTYKAPVARAALNAGADLVNDISALRLDAQMPALVAQARVPLILMHMQGIPQDMQVNPRYGDLMTEVKEFLRERREFAVSSGIAPDKIILDPGIGFGKTWEHNLELIQRLDEFQDLGCPVLLGASRKAFIGKLLDLPVTERDIGTLGVIAVGLIRGANIIRTHNVPWGRQVATVVEAILNFPASGDGQ
jgi:dihydropteroate synthase